MKFRKQRDKYRKHYAKGIPRGRVILVHGFNVRDGGEGSIDKLIPYLLELGYNVVEFDYGYRFLFGVRFCSEKDTRRLMDLWKPGDIPVGHSNGCTLISRAIDKGMPVKRAVFIHPALNKDWEPNPLHPIERIDVFYSKEDRATWAAKFLLFHRWGAMGTDGPQGDDPRMMGHEEDQSHSGGFKEHPEKYVETLA